MKQAGQCVDVVIIGAGFSGLGMAIKLKQSGRTDFLVLEQAADAGGCWRDNTYPGCACDVPAHLYCFSFAPRADWSRKYAGQAEIHEYLRQCVTRFQLEPYLRFNHCVMRLQFDDETQRWQVDLANGGTLSARIVVVGRGPLSVPKLPTIPGLAHFPGPVFHSSQWQHQHDLTGKRVAVVGTGASAIQFIPALAKVAGELTVFQRTPAWVFPRPDRTIGRLEQRLYQAWPALQHGYRQWLFRQHEWRYRALAQPASWSHSLAERLARRFIRRHVKDADKVRLLTPSYVLGCKRVLLSNDYYPAMNQPHVQLTPSALQSVDDHTLVAADGSRHDADVLVFGTGFEVADSLQPGWIIGPKHEDLGSRWQREGMQAYRGMAVAGMPNLFFLIGPNSGLGHNSLVLMVEAQIANILACLDHMQVNRYHACHVHPSAQQRFNQQIQNTFPATVWTSGCQSWYLDQHGRNTTLWPGLVTQYQQLMGKWAAEDYGWSMMDMPPALQNKKNRAEVAVMTG